MTKSLFLTKIQKELQRRKSIVAVAGTIFLVTRLFFCFFVSVSAQSEVVFTSEDIFEIPSKNSSIRFASNGTYEVARLEYSVWSFQNLYMFDSRATEKLNLTISATDCDLTIDPYVSTPYTYGVALLKWIILRYSISGQGTQVINLGFDPNKGQLDIILDDQFAARNQGWTKTDDGTIIITGTYSRVTLWYIEYPEKPQDSSFLDEHYLVIGSAGFLAIIVLLSVALKHRKKGTGDQ
ncbi:MAG: hypothetical protein JW815_01305 [Candidatus Bathyarchaeota archaeon]|nr:hypothetical protein [Candidatus Bathyarchaeum sp.]